MKAEIDEKELLAIASLAGLTITEGEQAALLQDLNAMRLFVAQIEEVACPAALREDEAPLQDAAPAETLSQTEALQNAAAQKDGFFFVPQKGAAYGD